MNLLLILALIAADPTPVDVAFQKVQADLVNLSKAQSDVAALSTATARLKIAVDALAASKATLLKALDDAANNVPAPVSKVVSMVVVSSDNCVPCKTLEPILVKLQGEGIPVTITKDAADVIKWKAVITPTLIMCVDGIEVSRSNGSQPEAALRTWITATKAWAK